MQDQLNRKNGNKARVPRMPQLSASSFTPRTAAAVPASALTPAGAVPQAAPVSAASPDNGYGVSYVSPYAERIARLSEELAGRGAFSYDPEKDALYNQYKALYDDLGRNAMKDAVGQAASLTGGYGSTYSASLGQNQYNTYLQKLAEQVPKLQQNAYSQWSAEGDELETLLSLLREEEAEDYDRWRAETEKQAKEQADAYDKYVKLISTTGYLPSEEELRAAGMSFAEAQAWAKLYRESESSGRGPGGGNRSGASASAVRAPGLIGLRYLDILNRLNSLQRSRAPSGAAFNTNVVPRGRAT